MLIALVVSGCMCGPAGPVGGVEFGSEGRVVEAAWGLVPLIATAGPVTESRMREVGRSIEVGPACST